MIINTAIERVSSAASTDYFFSQSELFIIKKKLVSLRSRLFSQVTGIVKLFDLTVVRCILQIVSRFVELCFTYCLSAGFFDEISYIYRVWSKDI